MEFKKLSFKPLFCPRILLPFWWILIILFYTVYTPIYVLVWLCCPAKRKHKSIITLEAEYRRDRH